VGASGGQRLDVLPSHHIGQAIGTENNDVVFLKRLGQQVHFYIPAPSPSQPAGQRAVILVILKPNMVTGQQASLTVADEIGPAVPDVGHIELTLMNNGRDDRGAHLRPGGDPLGQFVEGLVSSPDRLNEALPDIGVGIIIEPLSDDGGRHRAGGLAPFLSSSAVGYDVEMAARRAFLGRDSRALIDGVFVQLPSSSIGPHICING
jgi:hypothetical protein